MQMSNDTISISVSCFDGTNANYQPQNYESSIPRAQIETIGSKRNLAYHVLTGTRLGAEPADALVFERRSKKHKGYVPLESEADFKEFIRSLRVKNTTKIIVRSKNGLGAKEQVPSSTPLIGTDTVDQFRRLVNEFQKSEIYEILKSFSSLYTQAMNPDDSNTVAVDSASETTTPKSSASSTGLSEIEGRIAGVEHDGVVCDKCEPPEISIRGLRYKCMVCDDFDLCSKCYFSRPSVGTHSPHHAMMAIENSSVFKQFLRCRGLSLRALYPIFMNETESPESVAALREKIEVLKQKESLIKEMAEQAGQYEELKALLGENTENPFETLKEIIIQAQFKEVSCENAEDEVVEASHEKPVVESSDVHPDEIEDVEKETRSAADTSKRINYPEKVGEHLAEHAEPLFVEVAVVPKGRSLSQILITNKSTKTIDSTEMTMNVVNCFGMNVASIKIEKQQGIASNRTSKFNVAVSNTHFKYPFKVSLSSARFSGECQLSLKNMSGQFVLSPIQRTDSIDHVPAEGDTALNTSQADNLADHESFSSTLSYATASVHSILVPSLPREVQSSRMEAGDESSATNEDLTMSDDKDDDGDDYNDDYDLISVTEAEDADSDYEILADGDPATEVV